METLRLKSLELHNFGIFQDITLDFDNKDIVGILAQYYEASERSNRAGKSLILEGIKYNLIGKTRYSKASKMIHRGKDEMYTKAIYVDSNNFEYTVKRGVALKNSEGILHLNWCEKARENQESINALFGISKSDFELTTFFKQQDIDGFMDLTPGKKSEHVMMWMNNTHWSDKESAVKEDISALKEKIKDNDIVRKSYAEDLELEDRLLVEKSDIESKLKALQKEEEALLKDQKEVNRDIQSIDSKIEESNKKNREIKQEIRNITLKLEETEGIKNKLRSLNLDANKYEKQKSEIIFLKNISSKNDLLEKMANLKANIQTKTAQLNSMKKHKGGICPILKSACDRIDFSNEDIDKAELEIKKLHATLNKLIAENEKYKKLELINNKQQTIGNEITRFTDQLTNIVIEDTREVLNKELHEYNPDHLLNELEYFKKQQRALKDDIFDVTKQKNLLNQKLGVVTQKIKQSRDYLDKINEIEIQNEKNRNELEILLYIQRMFSKNGIPAAEIENAFQEVEDNINFILKELKSGLSVIFRPDKELDKWEPTCSCGFMFPKGYKKPECEECGSPRRKTRKEELSLKVLENGVESDFEGDSGGGRTIISYAVRIALTMFKRKQNQCKLNMLFLDEIDSALDPYLAATITDSITKLLTKKLGYEQILMVSHKREIQKAVPYIIKVTRFSDHSTAVFE